MRTSSGAITLAAATVAIFSLFTDMASAVGILCPPSQIPSKKIYTAVWAASGADELSLSAAGANVVTVRDKSGAEHTYISSSEAIFDVIRARSGVGVKMLYNPSDKVDFVFNGFTGTQELSIVSVAGVNTLAGDGASFGFGIRRVTQPGTLVTPSVVMDFAADFSRAFFGNMSVAGSPSPVNSVFTTAEYSVVATVSPRRKDNYEPWASGKVSRVYSELDDRESFRKVSGVRDRFALAAGLKYNFKPAESVFFETGLSPERYAAVGIAVGF